MFRFLATAVLLGSLGLSGCTATRSGDPRFEHEDVPESFERAQSIENEALKLVSNGNRTRHPGRRREFFSRAIHLLQEARQLYEDELVEKKGTPERQRTIEVEMDRISDQIAKLHKDRPAE